MFLKFINLLSPSIIIRNLLESIVWPDVTIDLITQKTSNTHRIAPYTVLKHLG